MRRVGNWLIRACGVLILSGVACGGASRKNVPGGSAGEGEERGDPPRPMKEGVPIGDCRENGETRPAECPAQPPTDATSCQAPNGLLRCPYAIRVSDGRAAQMVSFCQPEGLSWVSASVPCGDLCAPPGQHVLELPVTDCEERAPSSCASGAIFVFETNQQSFDALFESLLRPCLNEDLYSAFYEVEVESGCPVRVSSSQPFPESVAQCLRRGLSSVRWECALDLSCASHSAVLL